MCAAAWEGITRNLAQKIAGKNRGEHLKHRHWRALAAECGLNAPRLIKRVDELANAVMREARGAAVEVNAMPAGTHTLMPRFVEAIEQRARAIISGLSEDSPTEERVLISVPEPSKPARRPARKKVKAATQ